MPSLLEGQIASAIYAGFKGKLLKGTLWRGVSATSGGLDGYGDPVAIDPARWPCQGFTDKLAYRFKGREGIPETDSTVNIFAKSLPNGIAPQKDDKVQMPANTGPWWQLRAVETDPATALFVTAAFVCNAPSP